MFRLQALLIQRRIQAEHVYLFKLLNRALFALHKSDQRKFNKLINLLNV